MLSNIVRCGGTVNTVPPPGSRGRVDPPSRISRRFPPAGGPLSPAVVSSQIRPAFFLSAILIVGTEMPYSSWGSMSLYDLTFHMRNKPCRSSLVAWVAVVEAAFAVGAVHRGKSATSVPVSSVLAGLQPRWPI